MDRSSIAWGEVTLDYCDAQRAAEFWSELLGLEARTQSQPGWFQLGPAVPGGPVLNIQPVSEPKVGKSRIHLDLYASDLERASSLVERLGGRLLDAHSYGEWLIRVMADPEGVEFCLVGSAHTEPVEPAT